jgi:hypothetical protein
MTVIRKVNARDKPERVASRAAEYQARLERSLARAAQRATRSSPTVQALFASAVVKDMAVHGGVKGTKIIFTAPPFGGGLHQI